MTPLKSVTYLILIFHKIRPSLASQIQDTSSKYTDYNTPAEQISILTEISSWEIFKLIQKIPGNKGNSNRSCT